MEAIIPLPGVILVSAPIGAGKTHFLHYLCYLLAKTNKIEHVKVICPTAYTGSYNFIPSQHLYEVYNEVVIYEFIKEQEEIKRQGEDRKGLLILDDCIGSANLRSPIWEKLATTCRHPNITVIIVAQHVKRIPPTIRDNATTVIVLKTIDIDNLQALYDTCGRWKWKTFNDFQNYIQLNTENHQAILINPGKSVVIGKAPAKQRKYRLNY